MTWDGKTEDNDFTHPILYMSHYQMDSDTVEALFSQGFQDNTDARAAYYALRRIIESGVTKSGEGANSKSQDILFIH